MSKLKLLLFLSLFSVSCSNSSRRLEKAIVEFSGETITIPEDMVVVDGHRIENGNEVIPGRRKMIIYYDSLSCNACQVSHLIDLSAIYALADSSGIFDVMTIFSPRAEEYDELMKKLVLRNFVYPVYVDYSGSFRRANRFIQSDIRFHSFLIDGEARPVLVGNPVQSHELWKIFTKTIREYEKD